jgi:hypothetical protein
MAAYLIYSVLWIDRFADVPPLLLLFRYTQVYPPADRDLLLSWAGSHWKQGDPSASLPKPSMDHILLSSARE